MKWIISKRSVGWGSAGVIVDILPASTSREQINDIARAANALYSQRYDRGDTPFSGLVQRPVTVIDRLFNVFDLDRYLLSTEDFSPTINDPVYVCRTEDGDRLYLEQNELWVY